MTLAGIGTAALGLVIIYMILAAIVSQLQELLSRVLQKRSADLEVAIVGLITDSASSDGRTTKQQDRIEDAGTARTGGAEAVGNRIVLSDLAKEVYNHGLICGIIPGRRKPAYIPAQNFAMAFLDRLDDLAAVKAREGKGGGEAVEVQRLPLSEQIALMPDTSVFRGTLQALAKQADDDTEVFRRLLERHFDNAMDRLSGVYKQWAQARSLTIAAVLTIFLNLDSLAVFLAIQSDVRLQSAIARQALAIEAISQQKTAPDPVAAKEPTPPPSRNAAPPRALDKVLVDVAQSMLDAALPIGWVALPPNAACRWSAVTPFVDYEPQLDGSDAKPGSAEVRDAGTGSMGSKDGPHMGVALTPCEAGVWGGLLKLLGWGITALAATFGAPLWFRVFESIVRLTGLKPEKAGMEAHAST